jgi:IS4 transposase
MGNVLQKSIMRKCLEELHLHLLRFPIADRYAKKLTVSSAILLFVEGEIQQRRTLQDIQLHLQTDPTLQALTKVSSIDASTLNRKLERLPLEILHGIFHELAAQLKRKKRGAKGRATLGKLAPIDSTSFTLPYVWGDWAFYQDRTKGVKMHTRILCLDDEIPFPDQIVLSTVGVSDQMAVDRLVTHRELTYILDRGYVNFARFGRWVDEGISFVARLKASNNYTVIQDCAVEKPIVRDACVTVYDKKEKREVPLRLVEFEDLEGRCYKVVTTRYDLSAADVAEIYRCRWQIELFFKWIKQHLTTITFHNHHPQAVWAQLYLGVISYLLCQLVYVHHPSPLSLHEFVRLLRHYSQYDWDTLHQVLNESKTRSSRGRQKKDTCQPIPRGKPGVGKNKRPVVKIIVS